MYTVYILKSLKTGKRYFGYTNDLKRRLWEHNHATKGFALRHKPFQLLFTREFSRKNDATKFENYLKKLKGGNKFREIIDSWAHSSAGRADPS